MAARVTGFFLRLHRSHAGGLRVRAHSVLVWVLSIVLLPPAQAVAQKVTINYDKATNFSKFKTYAWVQGTPGFDPALDAYIKKSINDMLQHIGMTETNVAAADLVVTYHAAVSTDLSVGTALDPTFAASGGVAMAGHSIWETAGGAAATHVNKGGLAFEMLDRAANRLAWSGTAKHTISDKHSERWDQIQKAMDKLFRNFPPTPQARSS